MSVKRLNHMGTMMTVSVFYTCCIRTMPAAVFEVILLIIVVVASRAGHFESPFIRSINAT